MLLYTDIIAKDELFTDAFPVKLIDDIAYEVDCSMITVKSGADVDIGANPSTEEQDDVLEVGETKAIDVVFSFRLQPTTFDKKTYMTYLRNYMKALQDQLETDNPDRVEAFKSGANKFAKKILANFKDYEFYTGMTMNPDGMVALLNYREDGITPYFTFWKDGVKEEKL